MEKIRLVGYESMDMVDNSLNSLLALSKNVLHCWLRTSCIKAWLYLNFHNA